KAASNVPRATPFCWASGQRVCKNSWKSSGDDGALDASCAWASTWTNDAGKKSASANSVRTRKSWVLSHICRREPKSTLKANASLLGPPAIFCGRGRPYWLARLYRIPTYPKGISRRVRHEPRRFRKAKTSKPGAPHPRTGGGHRARPRRRGGLRADHASDCRLPGRDQ